MMRRAVVVDFAFVLLFVTLGRSSHHHGFGVVGIASTTWPFAVGLGAGWLGIARERRSGLSLRDGSRIVVVMVAVGMVLRVVAGQGTALAFILVALGFLGFMLLGWRLAYQWVLGRVNQR
jgi:hypothetical protein